MARHFKHCGIPIGLFRFGRDTDLQPDEVRDNPRHRPCPTCKAQPREPCTRPSRARGGITTIRGYHPSRCRPVDQEPPEKPPSSPVHARGGTR